MYLLGVLLWFWGRKPFLGFSLQLCSCLCSRILKVIVWSLPVYFIHFLVGLLRAHESHKVLYSCSISSSLGIQKCALKMSKLGFGKRLDFTGQGKHIFVNESKCNTRQQKWKCILLGASSHMVRCCSLGLRIKSPVRGREIKYGIIWKLILLRSKFQNWQVTVYMLVFERCSSALNRG